MDNIFTIKSITASTHDNSFGGYPFRVDVIVKMETKAYKQFKNNLGHLYGVLISNEVYRINPAIKAHGPMVDASRRAKKGVKTIILSYFDKDLDNAAKLGLIVEGQGSSRGKHSINQVIQLVAKTRFS